MTRERWDKIGDAMTERYGGWVVPCHPAGAAVPVQPPELRLRPDAGPVLDVLFWSWLCMLPGTILYVVALVTGIREGRVPWTLVAGELAVLTAAGWLLKRKILGNDGDQSEHAHDEDDHGGGPSGGMERGTNGDASRIG